MQCLCKFEFILRTGQLILIVHRSHVQVTTFVESIISIESIIGIESIITKPLFLR